MQSVEIESRMYFKRDALRHLLLIVKGKGTEIGINCGLMGLLGWLGERENVLGT